MAVCPLSDQRLRLITTNRHEYGDVYADLPFLTPDQEVLATARRSELIAALDGRVSFGCGGSKLDMRNLSPGCRICVEGSWSCLFINGRCNARCFFCNSEYLQNGQSIPWPKARGILEELDLEFLSEEDVARYLELQFPNHSLPDSFVRDVGLDIRKSDVAWGQFAGDSLKICPDPFVTLVEQIH